MLFEPSCFPEMKVFCALCHYSFFPFSLTMVCMCVWTGAGGRRRGALISIVFLGGAFCWIFVGWKRILPTKANIYSLRSAWGTDWFAEALHLSLSQGGKEVMSHLNKTAQTITPIFPEFTFISEAVKHRKLKVLHGGSNYCVWEQPTNCR